MKKLITRILKWLIDRILEREQRPGPFLLYLIQYDQEARQYLDSLNNVDFLLIRDRNRFLKLPDTKTNSVPIQNRRHYSQTERKSQTERNKRRAPCWWCAPVFLLISILALSSFLWYDNAVKEDLAPISLSPSEMTAKQTGPQNTINVITSNENNGDIMVPVRQNINKNIDENIDDNIDDKTDERTLKDESVIKAVFMSNLITEMTIEDFLSGEEQLEHHGNLSLFFLAPETLAWQYTKNLYDEQFFWSENRDSMNQWEQKTIVESVLNSNPLLACLKEPWE